MTVLLVLWQLGLEIGSFGDISFFLKSSRFSGYPNHVLGFSGWPAIPVQFHNAFKISPDYTVSEMPTLSIGLPGGFGERCQLIDLGQPVRCVNFLLAKDILSNKGLGFLKNAGVNWPRYNAISEMPTLSIIGLPALYWIYLERPIWLYILQREKLLHNQNWIAHRSKGFNIL